MVTSYATRTRSPTPRWVTSGADRVEPFGEETAFRQPFRCEERLGGVAEGHRTGDVGVVARGVADLPAHLPDQLRQPERQRPAARQLHGPEIEPWQAVGHAGQLV